MSPKVCPNCSKANLVKCKVLRQADPDCGKEYEACSHCKSKWFLDDPNRPSPDPNAKPKKSIWDKLATWGAPANSSDLPPGLHAATYFFPPAHDYPPVLFPVPEIPRASFLAPAIPQPSPVLPPVDPPSAPQEDPSPPQSLPDLDLPPPPPPPPPEPLPDLEPPSPPTPPPPEPGPSSQADCVNEPPVDQCIQTDSLSSHAPPDENEEQERYDMLMRIVQSPAPSCVNEPIQDPHLDSTPKSSLAPASPPPIEPIIPSGSPVSSSDSELHQRLLKVVSVPLSPSGPFSYAGSPEILTLQAVQTSLDVQEDLEIAAYAKRIAERLDDAIKKSPYINHDALLTPRTPALSGLGKSSRPTSPCLQRNSAVPSRQGSRPASRAPTPRAQQDKDDWISVPGGFPTPRTASLIDQGLRQLNSSPSPSCKSVRSAVHPSADLPASRSRHSSRSSALQNRTGQTRPLAGPSPLPHGTQSPLFN